MSYHHLGQGPSPKTSDEVCFPRKAVMRMRPRAAGPMRELMTTSGRAESVPVPWSRGMLVIDPRYDNLPIPVATS